MCAESWSTTQYLLVVKWVHRQELRDLFPVDGDAALSNNIIYTTKDVKILSDIFLSRVILLMPLLYHNTIHFNDQNMQFPYDLMEPIRFHWADPEKKKKPRASFFCFFFLDQQKVEKKRIEEESSTGLSVSRADRVSPQKKPLRSPSFLRRHFVTKPQEVLQRRHRRNLQCKSNRGHPLP